MRQVTEFRVRYAETDQMGVVYHANYLVWCEVGRTDLIRALGMPYAEVERGGIALAVVEARLTYKRGARYDDLVRVTTTVAEVRSRSVTFDYDIADVATGACLARGTTVLVAMTGAGKSIPIPAALRQALEGAIEA